MSNSLTAFPSLLRQALFVYLALVVAACARIPDKPAVEPGFAEASSEAGPLYEFAAEVDSRLAEPDGVLLIAGAREAMEWRLGMIDSATVSIDAQYFIWYGDASGNLMLRRVLQAADRGVKVRLLVDDLNLLSDSTLDGPDETLAAINSHPNVQLKIFNPGKYRSGTMGIAGNFGGSFKDFNRRMHNKLMIADGRLAIIGGRNIADEYFGLKEEYNFIDIDALAVGGVVASMSEAFDAYWNSDPAYPAAALMPDVGEQELVVLRDDLDRAIEENAERLASYPLEPRDWSAELASLVTELHGAETVFLQDDPEVEGDETRKLVDMLEDFDRDDDREVVIVSPYLLPLEGSIEQLAKDIDGGMEVSLMTASLASGDHTAVNAHYKKYRTRLLEAGASLYEFHHQPSAEVRALADVEPVKSGFVALHPKVGITDRKSCFVGSLNLDPRALVLNTENGLVIESESFCSELDDLVSDLLKPENSWHVTLDEGGKLQWTSYEGTVDKQPARSTGQRVSDFFFRLLPIESLL